MIITRTPFRITLGGGGTDLPSFYKNHGGFVFAMSINKYMFINAAQPFCDDKIRVHYSKSEEVDDVVQIKHELAREAFKLLGIKKRFIVSSIADIPSGTGLGSSSCYLVGLLNALHVHTKKFISVAELAEEACKIELDILGKPIGKQDQYMAAFGGATVLRIDKLGAVEVEEVDLPESITSRLTQNMHLYFTGQIHDTVSILRNQNNAMIFDINSSPWAVIDRKRVEANLLKIKDIGVSSYDAIVSGELDEWGRMLHEHWEAKKNLSSDITVNKVEQVYDYVRENFGVLGGKIVGAGGGGFVLLYCPKEHEKLEAFMTTHNMPRLHYSFEPDGSKVVAHV